MNKKKMLMILGCVISIALIAFYFYGLNSESRMYSKVGIASDKIETIFERSESLTSEIKMVKNLESNKIQVLKIKKTNYIIGQVYAKCDVIDLSRNKENEDIYFHKFDNKYLGFYVGELNIEGYKEDYIEIDGHKTYKVEYKGNLIEVFVAKDKERNLYTMITLNNKEIIYDLIK